MEKDEGYVNFDDIENIINELKEKRITINKGNYMKLSDFSTIKVNLERLFDRALFEMIERNYKKGGRKSRKNLKRKRSEFRRG